VRFTRAQLSVNSAILASFDLFIAAAVGAVSCVVVFVNVSMDFGLRQTTTECQSTIFFSTKKKRRRNDKEKITDTTGHDSEPA